MPTFFVLMIVVVAPDVGVIAEIVRKKRLYCCVTRAADTSIELDTCLSVHIPPRSKGPLTAEACDASYRRALEIFREHYPELDIKAIRCRSWMLSHELRELLPPDSNIITFQRKYALYPINSGGNDVFTFVFRGFSGDTLDLPEETSLQRAIKRVYLDGGYIYESGGIFPVSDVNT
jgi:hypothetical protein